MLLFFMNVAFAATVQFPSQTQAGEAQLSKQGSVWKFTNNLFTVSYELENSQLKFLGSPEMNIEGGTELFYIELGNGTKVNA